MNIKKKLGLAMATTALGATLLAGGSFALFTSSATNTGNTFTAGTLTIGDVTGGAAFATSTNIGNLAPGDSDTKKLKIKNTGNLDAWVKINSATTNIDNIANNGIGDLFEGANPVTITTDPTVVKIAANGGEYEFNVGYSFPLAAGNEYQGDTGTVTFNVVAVQARNNTVFGPGNTTEIGPISWN